MTDETWIGVNAHSWNAAIDAAVKILEAEHKIEPEHIPVRITTAMNKIKELKKPIAAGYESTFKDYWLCGCGNYHAKDYVCERIGK